MVYAYIVDTTPAQLWTGKVKKLIIQVNTALTGTITIVDGTSGSTANVATITNPPVGSRFVYLGLNNGARIIASTTCDVTASAEVY